MSRQKLSEVSKVESMKPTPRQVEFRLFRFLVIVARYGHRLHSIRSLVIVTRSRFLKVEDRVACRFLSLGLGLGRLDRIAFLITLGAFILLALFQRVLSLWRSARSR